MADKVTKEASFQLNKQMKAAQVLKMNIKQVFGEDDDLLLNAIEGETDLFETIEKVVRDIGVNKKLSEGLSSYILDLQDRKRRFDKRIENLRSLVFSALQIAEVKKKIELSSATISVVKPKAKIGNVIEAEIPSEYFVPQDPKLDRKKLLEALKSQAKLFEDEEQEASLREIPGAELIYDTGSISIRVK